MVKTETRVYCDVCGKDVTKVYAGSIDVLVHNGKIQEIIPEGYTFCLECMRSFHQWKESRRSNRREGD